MKVIDFKTWELIESLGDGTELLFTDRLECLGGKRNLDINNFDEEWGELSGAQGTIKYKVSIDVSKQGIESLYFDIQDIKLDIEVKDYKTNEDKPEERTYIINIDKSLIDEDNVEYSVHKFPLYLNNFSMDFSEVNNLEHDQDLKDIKYEFMVGEK